jgi:hypothetical protein
MLLISVCRHSVIILVSLENIVFSSNMVFHHLLFMFSVFILYIMFLHNYNEQSDVNCYMKLLKLF